MLCPSLCFLRWSRLQRHIMLHMNESWCCDLVFLWDGLGGAQPRRVFLGPSVGHPGPHYYLELDAPSTASVPSWFSSPSVSVAWAGPPSLSTVTLLSVNHAPLILVSLSSSSTYITLKWINKVINISQSVKYLPAEGTDPQTTSLKGVKTVID